MRPPNPLPALETEWFALFCRRNKHGQRRWAYFTLGGKVTSPVFLTQQDAQMWFNDVYGREVATVDDPPPSPTLSPVPAEPIPRDGSGQVVSEPGVPMRGQTQEERRAQLARRMASMKPPPEPAGVEIEKEDAGAKSPGTT